MKKTTLYPLKFYPQLKEKVWGGRKLTSLLGKEGNDRMGESWELSGVKNHCSIIANGFLKDASLDHLIKEFTAELMGERVYATYGDEFPLLFKFIDAREDLSVQLHPNDTLARQRHDSFGKTEMWYILQADEEARLILGFNEPIQKEAYLDSLSKGQITQLLHSEKVAQGDAFFIAPGTVHAIGAGVLLAEIQQTSDITYRIYDWDRPDVDGTLRELHTDLALDVISFEPSKARLHYPPSKNKEVLLCKSPYFETHLLSLSESFQKDCTQIDSFMVYMCVEGEAVIASEKIKKGETLMVPACFSKIDIETAGVTLLQVYVP